MTEIERIIEKGVITKDFLCPETICDFFVDENRKKIWAINLDLYEEFSKICDDYGLRYYAFAGTMLGAIRHRGFIPWDDDMDVCMPRKDYEKFIEIAQSKLSDPYFLQTVHSDSYYYRTIIRLINKNTTCLPVAFKHSGAINGIPLDIFPLDDYEHSTHDKDLEIIRDSAVRCSAFMKRNDIEIMDNDQRERWNKNMTDDPLREWKIVNDVATKYEGSESKYYCMKVFVIPGGRYNKPLNKEWFHSYKKVPFENTIIKVPCLYEKILEVIYGDYMSFPPIAKRGTWHDGVIIDPNMPFTKYIE